MAEFGAIGRHAFRQAIVAATTAALLAACGGTRLPDSQALPAEAELSEDIGASESLAVPMSVTCSTASGTRYSSLFTKYDYCEGLHPSDTNAKFGLYRPSGWSSGTTKRLVIYAHGYQDPRQAVIQPYEAFPELKTFRDYLMSKGYAVAWSSYSTNGFAVEDGTLRTDELRDYFAGKYGVPKRTYLTGHSLGGAVVLKLAQAQTGNTRYSGALPMCGFVGGSTLQTNYIGHVRTMFDAFYPGALEGNAVSAPTDLNYWHDVGKFRVQQAIDANTVNANSMWNVAETSLSNGVPTLRPFSLSEFKSWMDLALFFQVQGTNDFLSRAKGSVFDNSATNYGLVETETFKIARYKPFPEDPAAQQLVRAYLTRNYEPTASVPIPILTLHNWYDPAVPFRHAKALAVATTTSTGAANPRLWQQHVRTFGHCNFAVGEWYGALKDLVTWVESAKKPTMVDVTGRVTL
ncbi:MAG TPA: hypothetical protein VNT60_09375 [Deinococcales bacterium]|nr:hypothetical protein [Deinococcales bacterium]